MRMWNQYLLPLPVPLTDGAAYAEAKTAANLEEAAKAQAVVARDEEEDNKTKKAFTSTRKVGTSVLCSDK